MSRRMLVVSSAAINEPHRRAYTTVSRLLGWDVHVAAPRSIQFNAAAAPVNLAPAPGGAGYELHGLTLRMHGQQRLHWYQHLERLVVRLRPDWVFVEYDPGSLVVVQARLPAVRQRIVAFTTENMARNRSAGLKHALRSRRVRVAVREGAAGVLSRAGWGATDALACISKQSRRVFEEQGWRKPIGVVPLGTDVTAFQPRDESALRASLGLEDAFVVGYFGRLVPEKGVHLLIEAIAQTSPKVVLLLDMYTHFAPGSYAAQLMARANELGISDRIRVVDVLHADVPQYMRCCDAVVLPSMTTPRWKEQFGRVLPEAMACEVAVLGSKSGNIPDVIGDAGVLVAEGDVSGLARAIETLRADPQRRRTLGERGRRRVIEQFSLEAQARALEHLFAQL